MKIKSFLSAFLNKLLCKIGKSCLTVHELECRLKAMPTPMLTPREISRIQEFLTLNAPIATKVVCFSCLLKCLRSLYGKSVDSDQTAPIGAVCSGSTLFASILNLSVM